MGNFTNHTAADEDQTEIRLPALSPTCRDVSVSEPALREGACLAAVRSLHARAWESYRTQPARARRLIGKATEIIAARRDSDDAYLSLEVENLALQALEEARSHEDSTA